MSQIYLTGLTLLTLPKEPPGITKKRIQNKAIRKWEQMLKQWKLNCFKPDVPLLRKLIRLWGIPPAMRADVWLVLAGVFEVMVPGLYNKLIGKPSIHIGQINVDIPRTFGRWSTEDKKNSLRRVLVAYSNYRPEIGYCQGMNYIVSGILEALLGREELAFWLFERMLDPLRSLFCERMEGYFLTLRMFDAGIKRYTPALYDRFKRAGIHISTFIQVYLHSLFSYPPISRRFCYLVWDHYILELHTGKRFEFLFRLTLTIIRTYKKKIINLKPPDAVAFLKSGFQGGCSLQQNAKLLRSAWELSFDKDSILSELPRVSPLRSRHNNQYEFMKMKFRLAHDAQKLLRPKIASLPKAEFSFERHFEKINIDNCFVMAKSLDDARKGSSAIVAQQKQRADIQELAKKPKTIKRKGLLTSIPTREGTPESIEQSMLTKTLLPSYTTQDINRQHKPRDNNKPGKLISKPKTALLKSKPSQARTSDIYTK